MTDTLKIAELAEKSASTDMQVILTAKENAKRLAMDDPSAANLGALERATKMLESAMTAANALKNWSAALEYIEERGKKCKKDTLYKAIREGRLKKQADGSFKVRDVDRFAASLPHLTMPDAVTVQAADRQRRKEEADIRRSEAIAKKEEFDLSVKMGKYVPRADVYLELAARAATLASGLKTAFESRNLDLVDAVEGNPKKGAALVELLEGILDEALNEYSGEMEFAVTFTAEENPPGE